MSQELHRHSYNELWAASLMESAQEVLGENYDSFVAEFAKETYAATILKRGGKILAVAQYLDGIIPNIPLAREGLLGGLDLDVAQASLDLVREIRLEDINELTAKDITDQQILPVIIDLENGRATVGKLFTLRTKSGLVYLQNYFGILKRDNQYLTPLDQFSSFNS